MDLSIGDRVYLMIPLPYLKTADSMPMLRPADLVAPDEIGEVVGMNGSDNIKVRFRRGTFLIPTDHLSVNLPKGN